MLKIKLAKIDGKYLGAMITGHRIKYNYAESGRVSKVEKINEKSRSRSL